MELSDKDQRVTVTLSLDDWATVIVAMGKATVSLDTKERINSAIFEHARTTQRA